MFYFELDDSGGSSVCTALVIIIVPWLCGRGSLSLASSPLTLRFEVFEVYCSVCCASCNCLFMSSCRFLGASICCLIRFSSSILSEMVEFPLHSVLPFTGVVCLLEAIGCDLTKFL